MSPPIFSPNFYQKNLFGYVTPGVAKLSTFCPSFLSYRPFHAQLDPEGTIREVPFTFFQNFLRYFSFSQNADLVNVSKKLKDIEKELLSSVTPSLLTEIENEIQGENPCAGWKLLKNLESLNSCFVKSGQRGFLATRILNIVNCFRRIFGLRPIATETLNPNLGIIREKVSKSIDAFKLTLAQIAKCKLNPTFKINRGLLPPVLNPTNMLKLECGILEQIHFEYGKRAYTIRYHDSQFLLSCYSTQSFYEDRLYVSEQENDNYKDIQLDLKTYVRPPNLSQEHRTETKAAQLSLEGGKTYYIYVEIGNCLTISLPFCPAQS